MTDALKLAVQRRREIAGVLLLGLTTFLFLSLVTDKFQGSVNRPLEALGDVPNALGAPGSWTASLLYLLFGHAAHVVYCVTCVWGCMLLRGQLLDRLALRISGCLIITLSVSALFHTALTPLARSASAGGVFGGLMGISLIPWFGGITTGVVAVTFLIVGLLLATDFLFVHLLNTLRRMALLVLNTAAVLAARMTHGLLRCRRHYSALAVAKAAARVRGEAEESVAEADEEAPASARRPRIWLPGRGRVELPPEEASEETAADIRPFPMPRRGRGEVLDGSLEVFPEPEEELAVASEEPLSQPQQLEMAPREIRVTGASRPAAPTARRGAALLRRKKLMEDELPADYAYPKVFTKPPLDLFDPPPPAKNKDMTGQLRKISELLEETLRTFAIEARVTDITRGPTITRFELEPAPGIKVSRFLALADDLALALKAHRVRVEAPIPGKGRVGIEIPNTERDAVVMRELLESDTFQRSRARLPLAFGKDIAGDVAVADITAMPHLLVAGATGAGKTVCVKTLLANLLCSKTPEELQLLLIDPKMVELSIFDDIPHLITPVVIDPKKAASALNWLIVEMEERYRLFAHLRVRNIDVYNESVENGEIEVMAAENARETGESGESIHAIRKLPYIVCIIDELADLMMLARAEVEDAIARLAQLARAVGIHLIIATQRPSVDVLTGVIKANFPTRISFQVSSRVDSRCILDEIGAERLIGKGDMLYLPAGQSKPTRIQGAFVSDDEMNALIAYLKTQAPPQYRDEIANFGKAKETFDDAGDEHDELFDEAIRVVLETGQASISMVQRRLRVGYTRAARLIDMMEMKGIVGPHIGSKAREILVALPPTDEVA